VAPGAGGLRRAAGIRWVVGRIGGAAVSLGVIVVAAFALFRILPGDPVRAMTRGRAVDAAQLVALRHRYGLDRPLAAQFGGYLARLARGDLGTSYQYGRPVTGLILGRLWPTVYLAGTATLLAAGLGCWLGAHAAWRHGRAFDRIHTGLALTLWSLPTFWLGLLLIVGFGLGWGPFPGWFPTGGIDSPGVHGALAVPTDRLRHLTLPCLTLVAVLYAQYLLIMRASVLDELTAGYVRTARATGRHVVPNALLPTVNLVFANLGGVVSGAIVVETVFSWPGLGSLFYEALGVPDLPLLSGLFIVFGAGVIGANLLADLVSPLLDPRLRAA
jgi:peptide/nickel transport system permease protein